MEDYEQDAPQKPSTEEPKPLLTFWRLIVFCALLAVVMAVGLHYYEIHSRTRCDRAALSGIVLADAMLERLSNELVDMNRKFDDDEVMETLVNTDALRYLVGPYYGFRGGKWECEVLFRFAKVDNRWRIQGVALKGSQPAGSSSRYVYRTVSVGERVSPAIMTGIAPSGDEKSTHWNFYPYRETPDGPDLCYTESIVNYEKQARPGYPFVLRVPNRIPCDQIPGSN